MKSKNLTADGTNRVSALKRLSKPAPMNNSVHQRLSAPSTPAITDARQLLSNRNKPVFDARQLLSRQSSKTLDTPLVIRRDMETEEEEEEEEDDDNYQKPVVFQRSNNGRLTAGTLNPLLNKNPFISTEPISFTKTVSNISYKPSSQKPPTQSLSSDKKFVISFSNDQYRKRARSPSPTPPPIIKRLNNASIQTANPSISNRRDSDEPPRKQQNLSTSSKGSLKPTSTSTRPKTSPSDAATVLITNLQSSVTEDDVIELFGEIGRINEIKTLSRGCIQVIYSKEEYAKQAVANYHNQLLDGQLMYVSLQQPSYSTKSSKSVSSSTTTNTDESSNKYSLDPSFIRQALFNPSSNPSNPVQFQVKL